ncbi:helix-turn-helix domain-containing protein [Streptomyces sp. NPDC047990]|uniref:helix-turn-helix domain-containing protein n=1 Tax=Streptomyces sp. NPDC047990 TaxID=3365496 RepID=UPI003721F0D6
MADELDLQHQRLAHAARLRRHELGLSQKELARKAGIPLGQYERVEQGRGEYVEDKTFLALDAVFSWDPGTCLKTLHGATPGTIGEEDIAQAVLAATSTHTSLTAAEIRNIRDAVIAELQRRGLI